MTRFLTTPLRRALEKAVRAAREVAEEGAADAVRRLAVADAAAPASFDEEARALRRRLRAHARTLGDMAAADGTHQVQLLVEATGYAQWHRRLFARFLAERHLLRHPDHGSVSLEDCEELAPREGFADASAAAESYGARMLPGVFNPDDPVLMLKFAPEHAQVLRRLVEGLDAAIFQADDSLGWTYQFWRAAEKDRVNKAGEKIGAAELPAVTQLFTEPYIVRFLLHNTLGAWWAGKILAARPELATEATDEDALRAAVALPGYHFDMLRFVREGEDTPRWKPAAGTYQGWPTVAAKLTVLDPCCGSGHFLTEALTIVTRMRAEEEGLAPPEAVSAVLSDNLFGLEIDGRCVQIGAFAVALTAWKVGGWQSLPVPHIAWVGAPPPLPKPEFVALGNGDQDLREGLDKLWAVFVQAPLLGSLIEPIGGDLMSPQRLGRIEPLLDQLVEKTRGAEPTRAEGAVAARGMADAASILARHYVLAATNVPFLGRSKQVSALASYIQRSDAEAKADLATAMLSRILRLLSPGGTVAAVSPQNWLFLGTYKYLRARLLERFTFNFAALLGEHGFDSAAAAGAFTALVTMTATTPSQDTTFAGLDASEGTDAAAKSESLAGGTINKLPQREQLEAPDSVISTDPVSKLPRLSAYADSWQGLVTSDTSQFTLNFWEVFPIGLRWQRFISAPEKTSPFVGRELMLKWDDGRGDLHASKAHNFPPRGALKKQGVLASQIRTARVTRYTGEIFNDLSVPIIPRDENDLPAIFAFCESDEFLTSLRSQTRSLQIRAGYFVKAPFDLARWSRIAATRYPNGLPEPQSDSPTQWLFHGHPASAEAGTALHVALARLAGFRWPAEHDPDLWLSTEARRWITEAAGLPSADKDGLLGLEAVAGEQPLAQRLRAYLAAAFGSGWSDALERRLVAEADLVLDKRAARDSSLEAWLRDRAFRQHCRLFHDRPFLWQVSDAQADGFSAFLHYHRLDPAALRKLTYTILGDWIARMEGAGDTRRVEAAKILQQKLAAILAGAAPFDIFVRWKPLEKQPIGWEPDLDDGVRINIRPFVEAGVLRETPKIKWGVDRGKDVASAPWFPLDKGERNNDRHLTLEEKRTARARAAG